MIQIDATKLPTVKLGDSSRVRVGESVLAIGSPDSFANTVAAGIVSATSRTLQDGSSFPFFQTDIVANPDNSGGPLFNRAGEVVGIDVQIYADSDRSPSLAFAIPINMAAKVRSQVQAAQATSPGGLGVEVQDVGPGLAVAFGLPRPAGALVNSVAPGATITPLNKSWTDDPKKRASVESHIPLGKAATAEEIAGVFAFLASEDAAYITGQTIYADGGLTLSADYRKNWAS